MYFFYDPNGDGLTFCDKETAFEMAKATLKAERDDAMSSDGWDIPAVTQICWGKIMGKATLISGEMLEGKECEFEIKDITHHLSATEEGRASSYDT